MHCVDYVPEQEAELVAMWRASFERALGTTDPHPIEDQLEYLRTSVVPHYRVRVVLDQGVIIGFLAANREEIAQLYVHVDHQGRGVGTMLLDIAKQESGGRLALYTFARNEGARRFYEKRGFRIVERGFEPDWQLEDLRYEWTRSPSRS
ncbi:MAG: GNAT family N-acetyltransferase [Planctomycetota bacterium]|jgi:ribosomal protein S18 acetylase RimI-like enzyme